MRLLRKNSKYFKLIYFIENINSYLIQIKTQIKFQQ